MELEELVVGVKKVKLNELKELKVKLPLRLLVNLHYVKLTESRGISEVVNEALTQYFSDLQTSRPSKANAPADAAVVAALMPQEFASIAGRATGEHRPATPS